MLRFEFLGKTISSFNNFFQLSNFHPPPQIFQVFEIQILAPLLLFAIWVSEKKKSQGGAEKNALTPSDITETILWHLQSLGDLAGRGGNFKYHKFDSTYRFSTKQRVYTLED